MRNTLLVATSRMYPSAPDEALQFANKAIALDDKEALAHHSLGRVQTSRGDYDTAVDALRTAIELNPSLARAHYGLGLVLKLSGRPAEAIFECDTAIRLSPRDPLIWAFVSVRAWAQVLLGDYEAAVEDARRASRYPVSGIRYPGFGRTRTWHQRWPFLAGAKRRSAHSTIYLKPNQNLSHIPR